MRIFLNHIKIGEKDSLLVDLLAGDEPLARSMVINLDEMILIVEPTMKNLSVAKDMIQSLNKLEFEHFHILINKSFKEEDIDFVANELKVSKDRINRIPFSQEILELDNNCELTFDKLPVEIQDQIEDLFKSIYNKSRDKDLFKKRAKKIDERLYPDSKSEQTEKHHI
jgi:CO dehydrogenase nickel-insertion accessory protein CooC1